MEKFNVRKEFLKRNLAISSSKEIGYINSLEQQEKILNIGNIMVDIPQLIFSPFKCFPSTCIKKIRQNKKITYGGSCCTDLSIEATIDEIMKIKKLFSTTLVQRRKVPSTIITRVEALNKYEFFGQNDVYEYYLLSKEDNTCILSVINPRGEIYCVIDRICSFLNLPRWYYKPLVCFIWPLHYTEISPNSYFITLVNKKNYEFFGETKFFPKCFKEPLKDTPPAYMSLRQQIVYIFGQKFYTFLSKRASNILITKVASFE